MVDGSSQINRTPGTLPGFSFCLSSVMPLFCVLRRFYLYPYKHPTDTANAPQRATESHREPRRERDHTSSTAARVISFFCFLFCFRFSFGRGQEGITPLSALCAALCDFFNRPQQHSRYNALQVPLCPLCLLTGC